MDSFTLSDIIPATPSQIFNAWLTGEEHTLFTGSPATSDPVPGGRFTAWDGYIEGTTLELEANRRILQAWRTSEFPSAAESSLVEVLLVEVPDGTRLTLNHNRIPDGQGKDYLSGWKAYYFEPLKRHFGETTKVPAMPKAAAPQPKVEAQAKRPAPKKAAARPKAKAKRAAPKKAAARPKAEAKRAAPKKTTARPKARAAKHRASPKRKAPKKVAARRPTKKRRR